MSAFTYPEVGATGAGGSLPAGYHHARFHRPIGHGRSAFTAAVETVMTWAVHRGAGLRVEATAGRAAEGVDVTIGFGVGSLRLKAPCRVVWTVDEPRRAGFAYGTLTGHPAIGEESFVVDIDQHDDVWFTVTAFSRPATWYSRLGGPLTRAVQSAATRRYIAAARRITASH